MIKICSVTPPSHGCGQDVQKTYLLTCMENYVDILVQQITSHALIVEIAQVHIIIIMHVE